MPSAKRGAPRNSPTKSVAAPASDPAPDTLPDSVGGLSLFKLLQVKAQLLGWDSSHHRVMAVQYQREDGSVVILARTPSMETAQELAIIIRAYAKQRIAERDES